jgi:transcriptional regulator with XRE-family HTH domain
MPDHASSGAQYGRALRRLRTERCWTLAQVSERTGLPVSTLSKVENGKMSLSYARLARLCAGLAVDIAEWFVTDTTPPPALVSGRRSITRAGEGRLIDTQSFLHLYAAADLLNKRFVPIVAEVRVRSIDDFGELFSHPGEEYVYVLEGAIDVHTALYAPTKLSAGDAIYFDSGMAHAFIAASPGCCRILSISSTSEAQLLQAVANGTGNAARSVRAHHPATAAKVVSPASRKAPQKIAKSPASAKRGK